MKATYLTLILCALFILIEVPISTSIMLGMIISVLALQPYPMETMATLFYHSLNNYILVAIPLFMLAGLAMSYGGMSRRIFNFSEALVGFLPGSLGAVNVTTSLIFGGMSGSSAADVAALGSIFIGEMKKGGYSLSYATALTVAASTMAVIVPPSLLLIIYATVAGLSVGTQLMAGLLPGILVAVAMISYNTALGVKNKWKNTQPLRMLNILRTAKYGFIALMTPVIIMGGILTGWFTPTESSAVALVYALMVGAVVFRELNIKKIYFLFYHGGRTCGIVALELAAGLLFANLMTIEGIPEILVQHINAATSNPVLIMLMINLVLLLAGCFLNPGFSIIVLTPLLLPLAQGIGVHPIHFGVIMATNLAIGLLAPPVGICLYLGSVVSGLKVERIIRALLPFYVLLILCLIIIIYVPFLSMRLVDMMK
jgi:C4-dicarboxylate transporter DctM subunit